MDMVGGVAANRQTAFSIASIMSESLSEVGSGCYPYGYGGYGHTPLPQTHHHHQQHGQGTGMGVSGTAMDYYYGWGQSTPVTYNSGLKGMEGIC